MSEVKISKENLIKSYNEADKATKKTLEAIFGKDMCQPKNIMARVRTFNDACRELGDEHPFVKEWHLGVNLSRTLKRISSFGLSLPLSMRAGSQSLPKTR